MSIKLKDNRVATINPICSLMCALFLIRKFQLVSTELKYLILMKKPKVEKLDDITLLFDKHETEAIHLVGPAFQYFNTVAVISYSAEDVYAATFH